MFNFISKWFRSKPKATTRPPASVLSRTGAFKGSKAATRTVTRPRAQQRRDDPVGEDQAPVFIERTRKGTIAQRGTGNGAFARNQQRSSDTEDHETLTLVDDLNDASADEAGIDPYNTGSFDRSRNWDQRFRN